MTYMLFWQGREGVVSPTGISRFIMRGAVMLRVG